MTAHRLRAGVSYVDGDFGRDSREEKRRTPSRPYLSLVFPVPSFSQLLFRFLPRGLRVVTTEVTTLHHKQFVDGIVNRRV